MSAQHSEIFLPRITEANRPFWQGLSRGIFCSTKCDYCERTTFPPRSMCPSCLSEKMSWVDLSGKGTIYAFTQNRIVPRAYIPQAPYITAMIDLSEGPRLLSRIKGVKYEKIYIGQEVSVRFEPLNNQIVSFYFSPVSL
jgi:uncharacterized OB-fold protein